jgi:hypothetical protein
VAQGYERFESRFRQFIRIVEENLTLRRDARAHFRKLYENLGGGGYLTSEDQQTLYRNFTLYSRNRDELKRLTGPFNGYSERDVTFVYPATQPSKRTVDRGQAQEDGGAAIIVNPDDDLGRLTILEIKMWLAAKLVLADSYVFALSPYYEIGELRRQVDRDTIDPDARFLLVDVARRVHDEENYQRTMRLITLVGRILRHESDDPAGLLGRSKDNAYFNRLIEGSYAYRRLPELTVTDRLRADFSDFQKGFLDDLLHLGNKATYETSELFGNAVGLYEERKGKLYAMPERERKKITEILQPLDILFEKTPFRLTDLFIPGHWGPVAIWVGDSSAIPELKRLGVWQELPRIEANARSNLGYEGPSFRTLIERDQGVLEALRSGVRLNRFASFLNIDDLAIIRSNRLSDGQKKDYLLRAFKQVGKKYDFNFDVETDRQIVCSELAFVVYDDLDWSVSSSMGRYAVSPDQVALLALKTEDPFGPYLLYHDGRKLPPAFNRANFRRLLKGRYDEIQY